MAPKNSNFIFYSSFEQAPFISNRKGFKTEAFPSQNGSFSVHVSLRITPIERGNGLRSEYGSFAVHVSLRIAPIARENGLTSEYFGHFSDLQIAYSSV